MVAGDVDELGLRGAQDVLALGVAREVGVAALVLDVVAEVDEEVGAELLVHRADHAARELRRVVRELPELAVVVGGGPEVQVGDEAEREAHAPILLLPRRHDAGLRRGARAGRRVSIMRPVLIGAGRGSRLEHQTDELPKTLVHVMGRPMLEWILESLGAAGLHAGRT